MCELLQELQRCVNSWVLITPDRRIGGRVSFDGRFTPFVFSEDWIVGVELDAFDVPTVVRLRFK